ncbi:membrane-bound alpha-1,6- mannosyltransferase Initiation-specific [Irineochytrium annulatum]|nr:membrane-bound alpha-1,6- mannosyltransferase Initiation-specific [Irineochytrium annulatum]
MPGPPSTRVAVVLSVTALALLSLIAPYIVLHQQLPPRLAATPEPSYVRPAITSPIEDRLADDVVFTDAVPAPTDPLLFPDGAVASIIPAIIHQIWWQSSRLDDVPEPWNAWMRSWTAMNPGHVHHLLDGRGASRFIAAHFDERVVDAYEKLPMVVQRTDFLRYALLYVHGGLYADIDTIPLRPLHSWHPSVNMSGVSIVMGKEWNRRPFDKKPYLHRMSIGTWSLLSAPRHPLFARVINALVDRIEVTDDMQLNLVDRVVELCGPAFFTGTLGEYMEDVHGVSLDDISPPTSVNVVAVGGREPVGEGENRDFRIHDMIVMGVTRVAPNGPGGLGIGDEGSFLDHVMTGFRDDGWRTRPLMVERGGAIKSEEVA